MKSAHYFKIFLLLLFTFIVFIGVVFAEEEKDNSNYKSDLEKKIAELEEKLKNTQAQEVSLQRDIQSIESQVSITEYKITSANLQIQEKTQERKLLEDDIEFIQNSVVRLEENIKTKETVLEKRIREKYKMSRVNTLDRFLSNNGFSSLLNQIKYAKVAQELDQNLIEEMKETQKSYTLQHGVIEEKKKEVQLITQQLEQQKAEAERLKVELAGLKVQKDALLKVTQNDEKRYSDLLASAKRELDQIQGAANIVIRTGDAVDVKRGEVIGTMGNSGFSTGAHLHFSVYRYSVDDFMSTGNWGWYYSNSVNPVKKLKSKSVYWGTGCYLDPSGSTNTGDGDWDWPMGAPTITQNYGNNTCYNWMYGGKSHPALDMVASGDISVRAVEDGEAYFCRNCLGDGGNGVFVFHDDDYMTVYWHLK